MLARSLIDSARAPSPRWTSWVGVCLLTSAALALGGCKANSGGGGETRDDEVVGNRRSKVESRTVGAFNVVRVSRGLRVELKQGPHAVMVRGEENLVPLVQTTVEGGALIVTSSESLKPILPLFVTVTAPSVDVIAGSSAAKIVHTFAQDTLRIDCSSGAQCDGAGETKQLRISASSGAKVQAGSALTQSAEITASSGASVSVRALVRVTGSASSGAKVDVVGSPKERGLTVSSGAKVNWK